MIPHRLTTPRFPEFLSMAAPFSISSVPGYAGDFGNRRSHKKAKEMQRAKQ
jgi:hypothetical protein